MRKARKIAGSFNLPIIGVHHMEAHALVARYKINYELMTRYQVLIVFADVCSFSGAYDFLNSEFVFFIIQVTFLCSTFLHLMSSLFLLD